MTGRTVTGATSGQCVSVRSTSDTGRRTSCQARRRGNCCMGLAIRPREAGVPGGSVAGPLTRTARTGSEVRRESSKSLPDGRSAPDPRPAHAAYAAGNGANLCVTGLPPERRHTAETHCRVHLGVATLDHAARRAASVFARSRGVRSPSIADRAVSGLRPDPRALEQSRAQERQSAQCHLQVVGELQ